METLEDLMYRTMEEFEGSGTLEMYTGLQELKPLEIKGASEPIQFKEFGGLGICDISHPEGTGGTFEQKIFELNPNPDVGKGEVSIYIDVSGNMKVMGRNTDINNHRDKKLLELYPGPTEQ